MSKLEDQQPEGFFEEPTESDKELVEWVVGHTERWRTYRDTNFRDDWEEYERIFRGQWAAEDRTRDSERSRIISPMTLQAVESYTAEIDEAVFGSGNFFDIEDDFCDKDKTDIEVMKNNLTYEFKKNKMRYVMQEVELLAAVYGTGIVELIVKEKEVMAPATQPIPGTGMGAVGVSGNINYMGLRVYVKPSVFLKLAYSHPNLDTTYIQQQLSLGKAIGAPFLSIEIPESWISPDSHYDQVKEGDLTEPARITGHEGRHRMAAIMKEYGDVPIETHLLFNGLRRRHITDNMVERLNADILNEHGKILIGPWFSLTQTSTEGLSHTDQEK